MSVKAMAKVFEMNLPPREKFVLIALADWANDAGGGVYPATETVAKKTGYGITTIKKVFKILEKAEIIRRNGKKGSGQICWIIDLSWRGKRKEIEVIISQVDTRVASHTGDYLARHTGDEQVDTRVTTIHQYPSINHQGNDILLDAAIQMTGLLPTPKDLEEVREWEKDGAIESDITDAIAWRNETGKKPVRSIAQLSAGVKYSRLTRIQKESGKSNQPERNQFGL